MRKDVVSQIRHSLRPIRSRFRLRDVKLKKDRVIIQPMYQDLNVADMFALFGNIKWLCFAESPDSIEMRQQYTLNGTTYPFLIIIHTKAKHTLMGLPKPKKLKPKIKKNEIAGAGILGDVL